MISSPPGRGVQLVRQVAQGWHSDPFGNRVRYSRDTLDRWIRAWRQGGFAALVPSPRQTALRTDADILAVAAALKRENPARTAAQVQRILVDGERVGAVAVDAAAVVPPPGATRRGRPHRR